MGHHSHCLGLDCQGGEVRRVGGSNMSEEGGWKKEDQRKRGSSYWGERAVSQSHRGACEK